MTVTYPLTLLYDAACPVCALEMDWLRARDDAGRLVFVDIGAAGFDASAYGTTPAALDAEIHGICADGRVVVGMQTLRLAYAAVGRGGIAQITGVGPLKPLFDAGYRWFARHRHRISRGAAPLIDALRARRFKERRAACSAGACAGPHGDDIRRRPS